MAENVEESAAAPAPPASQPHDAPGELSSVARLLRVFVSPRAVFTDIARKPSWLLAAGFLGVLTATSGLIVATRLDIDATIAEQMSGRDVPPEAMDQALKMAHIFKYVGPASSVITLPLVMALIALIFWLALKVFSSDTRFDVVFSTTLHAFLPASVVGAVFGVAAALSRASIVASEAQQLVKSNIGAFLSPDTPKALLALASSADVLSLWTVVLLVLGLETVGRISRGRATAVVCGAWGVYILFKVGMAFLQGLMGAA